MQHIIAQVSANVFALKPQLKSVTHVRHSESSTHGCRFNVPTMYTTTLNLHVYHFTLSEELVHPNPEQPCASNILLHGAGPRPVILWSGGVIQVTFNPNQTMSICHQNWAEGCERAEVWGVFSLTKASLRISPPVSSMKYIQSTS